MEERREAVVVELEHGSLPEECLPTDVSSSMLKSFSSVAAPHPSPHAYVMEEAAGLTSAAER